MGQKQVKVNSPLPSKVPEELLGGVSNKQTINKLAERHIIGTKTMLSEKCVGCDGRVLLFWRGDVPYFQHQENNFVCTADPITETASYRLAKKYMCDYFNRGGKVIFTSKCKLCKETINTHLPSLPISAVQDVTYFDQEEIQHTFDAGLKIDDRLLLGIAICHSDSIGVYYSQVDVLWCNILDTDVLTKLDFISEEPVILQNHRSDMCCLNCKETKLTVWKD
jgi:hypothetical protein